MSREKVNFELRTIGVPGVWYKQTVQEEKQSYSVSILCFSDSLWALFRGGLSVVEEAISNSKFLSWGYVV